MNEDLIALLARERSERMLREAAAFAIMTERTSLRFGPSLLTRARRSLSRELARLSCALDPSTTV